MQACAWIGTEPQLLGLLGPCRAALGACLTDWGVGAGETTPAFCAKHKAEGMVDVANRRCAAQGCQKAPLFNFPGQLRRLFCADHKAEGMVNLRLHKAAEQSLAAQQQAVVVQHAAAAAAAARQGLDATALLAMPPGAVPLGPLPGVPGAAPAGSMSAALHQVGSVQCLALCAALLKRCRILVPLTACIACCRPLHAWPNLRSAGDDVSVLFSFVEGSVHCKAQTSERGSASCCHRVTLFITEHLPCLALTME